MLMKFTFSASRLLGSWHAADTDHPRKTSPSKLHELPRNETVSFVNGG